MAKSESKWLSQHLVKWEEFLIPAFRFREVDGVYYIVIDSSNVFLFQKKMNKALENRGL